MDKKIAAKRNGALRVAFILEGPHFTINRSDKEYDRPYDRLCDGYFTTDARLFWTKLSDGPGDKLARYRKILRIPKRLLHAIKGSYVIGQDVATLHDLGVHRPCKYSLYGDECSPCVAELEVETPVDSNAVRITTGRVYHPESEDADEQGCIRVITGISYGGKQLDFSWGDEMPDDGWPVDLDEEYHWIVHKGVAKAEVRTQCVNEEPSLSEEDLREERKTRLAFMKSLLNDMQK